MFSRTLSKITAALPSFIKYKMSKMKPQYTFLIRLGQPEVKIRTDAGTFNWKIDRLTTQEYILGTYEYYMQKAFLSFVRPGAVVYDVGAHAGFHSLFCGLLVGSSGKVIAFEPHPKSCASIKQQILMNPDLPVAVFPCALSDHCGLLRLDTSRASSQCQITKSGDMVVEARSVDSLVERGSLAPPHLIKIDVEGHEEQVIIGSLNTVKAYKPIILCDYHDDTTLSMIVKLLAPVSYRIKAGPPIIALPNHMAENAVL